MHYVRLINPCTSLANCPAGLSHNKENETCVECPIGTYQPVQGQTECLSCATNLTTAFNGTVEEEDCIGKVPYILILSHSDQMITFATTFSLLVNSLICPLVSQLTVQLVRTAHRTELALYVRLELINLLRVSRPVFLVVKI